MKNMAARKYRFERLTPIDNMDLNVYEEAIDYVFSNSDVKNVAISGAYSAGKSSVLASYKKKHGELRFLHISLAHFKSTDQESDAEVKESTLEGKILNQLIHQIPSEKIPQTNFRVKKTVSSKSIATSTIGAVLFLISILHLLFFSVWKNYISVLPVSLIKSILMPSTHPYALIVDGIIILVLLSLSVHKLIRIQREKNIFRKLNIKGNEIEIFEKSDDSYFDKYLNEVLYLFENADADVIVFEDMDRFNTNGIFERLREVNTLANIQLNKKNEKVLRFFYLLRDDIFDSKDRTKFFDYIIPVVPVVDGSNSYDQFISQLKSAGTFEKFDKSFLQGLSLYIDDMRLLKNIYNEFVIYYNRLNITELDCNKMLAIIAYTKCGILCCFLILLPILNFYLHIFQKNYMQIVLVISCFLHIMCYNYVQKGWCCMRKFDYSFLNNGLLPANLVNLTSNIAALKTMAGVRKDEYTQIFTELEAVAKVQSIKSSNAIEGIVTSDERIAAIVNQNSAPLNHNEAEIAGYRDALNEIHLGYEHIDFRQSDILRLHEMMMSFAGYEYGGQYKTDDNVILEIDADGNRRVRFRPTPASETPKAMRNDLLEEERPTDIVDEVLLKVIDAPAKKVRCRNDEARE